MGKAPEFRQVGNDTVASFSVAVSRGKAEKKKTTWYRCSIWYTNEQPKVLEYIEGGTQVFLEGLPNVSVFKNRDGETVASIELTVNGFDIRLLGKKDKEDKPETEPEKQETNTAQPQTANAGEATISNIKFKGKLISDLTEIELQDGIKGLEAWIANAVTNPNFDDPKMLNESDLRVKLMKERLAYLQSDVDLPF